jgi:hypothetical protein
MSTFSSSVWRVTLGGDTDLPQAATYLLNSLQNYAYHCACQDQTIRADVEQVINWWLGLNLAAKATAKKQRHNGSAAIYSSDLSTDDWRLAFSRMTVQEASELIICTLFDAGCDYRYGTTVMRRCLTAWSSLAANGGRGGEPVAPTLSPK